MLNYTAGPLLAGFFLDLLFGDPDWLYHPVRIIGNSIAFLEKVIRRIFPKTEAGERWGGRLLVVLICAGSFCLPLLLLLLVFRINSVAGFLLESFLCYQMLAVKSLKQESMKVYRALKKKDLPKARKAVGRIVGRDTDALDETGVGKAAVETVAENASDGIIAPMFYMILGGPPLLYLYKAINTMDSMVGYKNQTYIYFGRAAAKLDDLANFIPARLSGGLMIAAAPLVGLDAKNGFAIFRRDRFNHASPNSAQTEAVMAGALRVQLAGDAFYFGERYAKPTIGDALRPVEPEDILRANRLVYAASALGAAVFSLLHLLLVVFF